MRDMSSQVTRYVLPRLEESLEDSRIVVIQGARQVGKTTLVREFVDQRSGRFVTLDDNLTRAAAEADPVGFLEQAGDAMLAVDEVQRVPGLILALKQVVDRSPRPGAFLLTGSADLLRLPAMEDSLAGRAESLELFGFSQGEIDGTRERFVDRVMSGETFVGHVGTSTRQEYLERAVAGSYPEALARQPGRRRNAWLDNYVSRIIERDAREISGTQRLGDLPVVLRVLASRNATELNVADVANDTGIPASTLARHIDLLETLYLIHRIPAWSTNLTTRVVSRPKSMILDAGLAARLIRVSATGMSTATNPDAAGGLLEGFVIGEIRRQLGWAEEAVTLYHYRDRAGDEVDLIMESDDGRVVGIEVKASASVGARATRWLARLRDRLGGRFVAGLVLHTGTTSAPFGDRIAAVPIDVLWQG